MRVSTFTSLKDIEDNGLVVRCRFCKALTTVHELCKVGSEEEVALCFIAHANDPIGEARMWYMMRDTGSTRAS